LTELRCHKAKFGNGIVVATLALQSLGALKFLVGRKILASRIVLPQDPACSTRRQNADKKD
jgi:hypothetical protein